MHKIRADRDDKGEDEEHAEGDMMKEIMKGRMTDMMKEMIGVASVGWNRDRN